MSDWRDKADALIRRRADVIGLVKSALAPANGHSSSIVVREQTGARSAPAIEDLLFDIEWYTRCYPDAALEVRQGKFPSLRAHYEKAGFLAGFRPSALFVPSTYEHDIRSSYSRATETDPITHYIREGSARRASAHWLFDEAFYLGQYPDVAAAVAANSLISGYHHFLSVCAREARRPHPLFNPILYRELNDVAAVEATFAHYARHGAFSDALTSGLFDPAWYASISNDVVPHVGFGRTFDNLLHHFLRYGAAEGRSPVPDFDKEYYTRTNPGLGSLIGDGTYRSAAEHWIYRGVREGINPNRFFNAQYYLDHNPSVRDEINKLGLLGPFEHFVLFGHKRGLRCNVPLVQVPIDESHAQAAYARRARTTAMLCRGRARAPAVDIGTSEHAPDVSIVLPVHNHADFTFHLLADLTTRKFGCEVEIVVVDNASSDETVEIARYFPAVKVLRNDTNEGFPKACNRGFRESKGRIVIFANNDIEVAPGSIDGMMDLLATHPDIGAVGPRIIRMHGRLQEAGGAVYMDGSTGGHGRDDDPEAPRYGWVQDVHYCSAVFLAVRRELLAETAPFDEDFSPGYYEEVDLCARIWTSGYRVVVEPSAVVFHFEYASFSNGRPQAANSALIRRNKQRFIEKHAAFLSSCSPRLSTSPFESVGRTSGKPTVLLVEDFLPLPFLGSGFPRASRIVRALSDLGFHVVLYALFHHRAGTWIDSKELLPPLEVYYDDESPGVLDELLRTRDFDAVWICRTHNIERVLGKLSALGSLRKRPTLVLDTEALSSNRSAALRALNAGREATGAELADVRSELAGADVFDCIVAVNELERRQIAAAFPTRKVALIGHEVPSTGEGNNFEQRSGFCFVGSIHTRASPNYEGLAWFLEEVWPFIRAGDSAATLAIAGYWDPQAMLPDAVSAPGVTFLGAVSDLTALYTSSRVFVAPVRYAAGIPLKVQEAAAHGLPCVITRILAEQIATRHGEAAAVASGLDARQFANAALELYHSPSLWKQVQQGALNRVNTDWSLKQLVDGIRGALSSTRT
jgi:O-antigen biosynthesis protein